MSIRDASPPQQLPHPSAPPLMADQPPLPPAEATQPLYTDSGTFLSRRLSPVNEEGQQQQQTMPQPSAPPAEAFVSLWPASQGDAALEQAQLHAELEEHGEDHEEIPAAQVPPNELMDIDESEARDNDEEVEERKESDGIPQQHPDRPVSPLHASVSALRAVLGASPAPPAPSAYATCLRTLIHAVDNVLENPRVEKFRLLPLGNAKFKAKVGGGDARMLERASLLLQRLGWTLVETGGDDAFLLLTDEFRDEATLRHAKSLLEHELAAAQELVDSSVSVKNAGAPAIAGGSGPVFVPAVPASAAPAPHPVAAPVASPSANLSSLDSVLYQPLSALKKAYKRKDGGPPRPAATAKLSREQMAARVAERLQGGGHNAAPEGGTPSVRAGKIMDLSHSAALRTQLADVRREKHNKWVRGAQSRKRVYTVADLAAMEEEEMKSRAAVGAAGGGAAAAVAGGGGSKFRTLADFGAGSPQDCLKLGQEMLRLSNEFRMREGKRPLQWHPKLHEIGLVHSKNMALKKVAFGHDGAKGRFAAYPFHAQSAAENVAWSQGVPDVARCHVEGWINSPGHRKNLLAHHNWCTIAVFRDSEGAYYSTQLFGLG